MVLKYADTLSLSTYVTVSSIQQQKKQICTMFTFYSNTIFVITINHKSMNKGSTVMKKKRMDFIELNGAK